MQHALAEARPRLHVDEVIGPHYSVQLPAYCADNLRFAVDEYAAGGARAEARKERLRAAAVVAGQYVPNGERKLVPSLANPAYYRGAHKKMARRDSTQPIGTSLPLGTNQLNKQSKS
jgi:hypothetical protein